MPVTSQVSGVPCVLTQGLGAPNSFSPIVSLGMWELHGNGEMLLRGSPERAS